MSRDLGLKSEKEFTTASQRSEMHKANWFLDATTTTTMAAVVEVAALHFSFCLEWLISPMQNVN